MSIPPPNEWWEFIRDVILFATGIGITIWMVVTHDLNAGLIALVSAFCGLGAFGRAQRSRPKK